RERGRQAPGGAPVADDRRVDLPSRPREGSDRLRPFLEERRRGLPARTFPPGQELVPVPSALAIRRVGRILHLSIERGAVAPERRDVIQAECVVGLDLDPPELAIRAEPPEQQVDRDDVLIVVALTPRAGSL